MATMMTLSRQLPLADLPVALNELSELVSFDDYIAMALVAFFSSIWLLRGRMWDKPDPFLYKMFERPQEKMGGKKGVQVTRNIAEKLEEVGAEIVVFWGSQSGTAERLANRISKEIRQRFGIKAIPADCSDYESASVEELPQNKIALFIVSTFGEGDPSDNLHDMWSWLEAAKGTPLENLRFMALGLGNSNYKHYNAVVDHVSKRLVSLGAQPMLPTGRADDGKGETEEHYLSWKDSVFNKLKQIGYEEHDPTFEPSISIERPVDTVAAHYGVPVQLNLSRTASRITSAPHALPIEAARELFGTSDGRNCIHIELDLSRYPKLKYKTGDHLGVWPSNPENETGRLLRCLALTKNRENFISIATLEAGSKLKIPSPTTLDALFTYYLEVCAPVSRETVASLAQFAPSQEARAFLAKLGEDTTEFSKYLSSNYVTLGRLLERAAAAEGAWNELPLSFVIEALPAMQPRYYSISSSSVVQPRHASITAVVSDKTFPDCSERISGLATNHLLALKESLETQAKPHPHGLTYALNGPQDVLAGGKLHVQIRKSTFKLPTLASQPIIMVAAGTGLAPFRGFLQERARLLRMGREVGRMLLFFGCRNEAKDFIYKDELDEMQGVLGDRLSIITAFSRPDQGQKRYVQDCVREHSDDVCNLIQTYNAYFYICGSAAMAREVSNIVGAELGSREGWDESELKMFGDRQKKQNRWQQDVWG
ncbi:hypothetical protein K431DRAFT_268481 [Polychaeton citri CBS 116435]|uniref:NADPH--cytochrome P450 reductase n=1 Tax=Polychaeton citri CBS 116435 TaxID=1314669 RepID=A0A9P4QB46_9PEZI|nr:hypothetical protein K431DRAFT_268481 [Polychaeton citri CBS 116435]